METGRRIATLAAGFVALLSLAGCATGLYDEGQAARPRPGADVYQRTLVTEYQGLARTAQARANWASAGRFSRKAVDAAAGREVLPEPVVDPALSPDAVDELDKSRDRLLQALAVGGAAKDGELAGKTQGNFDCWLERAENGLFPQQVSACRSAFMGGLAKLEALFPPPAPPRSATPAAPTPRGPWTALFESSSADITFEGQLEINKASAALLDNPKTKAEISGHSDLPGSARSNQKISALRASAVADTLELLGVARPRLQTRAFGETRPVVKTSKPEVRNRRVEIRIVD